MRRPTMSLGGAIVFYGILGYLAIQILPDLFRFALVLIGSMLLFAPFVIGGAILLSGMYIWVSKKIGIIDNDPRFHVAKGKGWF